MVNLVIVSHSPSLATGVAELARAMTQQSPLIIATAAGTGDAQQPLGTNAEQIHHAIEAAYSDDGVLVLMDLGSAVLGAEMALDFLSPDKREHVKLIAAPLVEGAVAAAPARRHRSSCQALGALFMKSRASSHRGNGNTNLRPAGRVRSADVTTNRLGCIARGAVRETAARFKSEVLLARSR
jgi:phosphocarrier protein FPr